MDPVSELIRSWKIPVGAWGKAVIEFIVDWFQWLFDAIKISLNFVVEGSTGLLLLLPPVVLALLLAGLAYWLRRSWKLALGVLVGLLFIINQGLWKETVQTLVLVVGSTALSMAIGVPLGIWAAHKPKVWKITQPVLDLMQTMPTFVYLIPILILFGLGAAPALIVTIIFAMPAPVRMTYLGITSIPRPMIEAGESFGATRRQLLWKVELPAALPSIMAGLTQCIMLSLSMVVFATLIGAPSLGNPVNKALANRNIPLGIEAGLAIVILAIILDRVLAVQAGSKEMTTAVEFKNVDIIFGNNTNEALAMARAGAQRSDILAKTGAVLGATGANLTVREGEISVLMGLSGSGKSTLLRAVNGLNKVTGGQVLVRDGSRMVDVASCDEATLRHIRQKQVAMVFQQFALLPWRTVRENAGLGLELAGMPLAERNEKVDRQLKLVGLEQWAGKFVHELSGGMQQRVGLARAFATEAPILLMDEPFSALDPLIRTKLQDELMQLQRTIKKTIIFVSHDLEEALKIGNTITIMEGGRIVQSGRPEDIVLRPANDYVRDFIANVNPLSVLTAWNVMHGVADLEKTADGWVWLDARKTTRFKLDENDKVLDAERDKKKTAWISCADIETKPVPEGKRPAYWARPGTTLKTVMLAMHHTDTAPVALFDDDDRFVGSIGVKDVLRAVLKRSE